MVATLFKTELQICFFNKKNITFLYSSHWGFPVSANLFVIKIANFNKRFIYGKQSRKLFYSRILQATILRGDSKCQK